MLVAVSLYLSLVYEIFHSLTVSPVSAHAYVCYIECNAKYGIYKPLLLKPTLFLPDTALPCECNIQHCVARFFTFCIQSKKSLCIVSYFQSLVRKTLTHSRVSQSPSC
jgi:hypothetical protein